MEEAPKKQGCSLIIEDCFANEQHLMSEAPNLLLMKKPISTQDIKNYYVTYETLQIYTCKEAIFIPLQMCSMFLLFAKTALSLTLNLQSEYSPYTGVTIQSYRASNPNTDVTVALVNLCATGIHVDATHIENAYRSVDSWANQVNVQVAMNADFYRTNPIRVYGGAIGNGVQWPTINTGLDNSYSSEWYYNKFGWIAFGHDWVDYTYTKWVKNHVNHFNVPIGGWAPTTVSPPYRSGTIALVSGFPTLVMEGEVYSCSSPTDSSCFPDRSDMRDRNPRSAVGLTEDHQTLIMVAVDGRTSSNTGMYGAELADLMGQLGAHFAINVDGGGSTQLWESGYINSPSETYRSVVNHLGVFAGTASNMSSRPGHCETQVACQILPPEGGIIDNTSDCFSTWGPETYWRTESQGYNGQLRWTNAFSNDVSINWVWWQIALVSAGEYEVEYYGTPEFSVHDDVPHLIVANGQEFELTIDQSGASGWTSLGTYSFASGGNQFLAVYDNNVGSVPSNQHIVADAIRLTRVGEWCGNEICDSSEGCDCPEDCALASEIPNNGIDDDCDGTIDPIETSSECDENETSTWCLNTSTLGICNAGNYSELSCVDMAQICSTNQETCIDINCVDRENESWCDGDVVQHCVEGNWSEEICDETEICDFDSCIESNYQNDSAGENSLSEQGIEESKGSCAGSGMGILLLFLGWRRNTLNIGASSIKCC
jgi:hypothetical protein